MGATQALRRGSDDEAPRRRPWGPGTAAARNPPLAPVPRSRRMSRGRAGPGRRLPLLGAGRRRKVRPAPRRGTRVARPEETIRPPVPWLAAELVRRRRGDALERLRTRLGWAPGLTVGTDWRVAARRRRPRRRALATSGPVRMAPRACGSCSRAAAVCCGEQDHAGLGRGGAGEQVSAPASSSL